jgi:hypothetical protein
MKSKEKDIYLKNEFQLDFDCDEITNFPLTNLLKF